MTTSKKTQKIHIKKKATASQILTAIKIGATNKKSAKMALKKAKIAQSGSLGFKKPVATKILAKKKAIGRPARMKAA